MKKILVAVDFSDDSVRAVAAALDVADSFDARLFVLHVLHDPSDTPGFYSAKKAGRKVWRNLEESAQEMMKEFVKTHVKTRRKFDTAIVPGLPYAQILQVAQKEKVDLIVMGTHGRSGWERLLLGSVADRVICRATCPVMVIPNPQTDGKKGQMKERKDDENKKRKGKKKKESTGAGTEDDLVSPPPLDTETGGGEDEQRSAGET